MKTPDPAICQGSLHFREISKVTARAQMNSTPRSAPQLLTTPADPIWQGEAGNAAPQFPSFSLLRTKGETPPDSKVSPS